MTQEARYYYDCPIKAAFMVRHHGFKVLFETSNGKLLEWHRQWIHLYKPECPEKFFVSEESLPLLQPQVGDVIVRIDEEYTHANWISSVDGDVLYTKHRDCLRQWLGNGSGCKIIQRNGTPFIMPERGE